jgi:hypothetical protein
VEQVATAVRELHRSTASDRHPFHEQDRTTSPHTFTALQTAAVVAAILAAGVAAFQLALAAGAPLGDAVFGGNAPTHDGVLTSPFRALAAFQTIMLLLLGWVLLARTSVVTLPLLSGSTLGWLAWVIVAFLALNTVANFAASHPVERWVMGSITLALTGIGLTIALRAPDLT